MLPSTSNDKRTVVRGLGEIVLRVNNLDAMQKFYEEVIGLPLMTRVPNCAFFKIADGYGGHTQVLALFDRSQSPDNRGTDAATSTIDHIAFEIGFLAYLFITLEMLFMVTPFALYYYSVYSPLLAGSFSLPATAWLPAFFLPHLSTEILPSMGGLIFLLGLVGFVLSAFQLYYAKFRRRGVVGSGFYKRIRHPQYLFLALAGLGLLIVWPRFIVLPLADFADELKRLKGLGLQVETLSSSVVVELVRREKFDGAVAAEREQRGATRPPCCEEGYRSLYWLTSHLCSAGGS